MAEAAISLATSAASPILTKLADKALSYFGGDVTEEELRNLKSIILPKIQTVIKAVDNINKIELRPWVMNLRAAAYEAEDVLDMYEYNHLQAKVSPPPDSLKKFNRMAKKFFAPVTLKTKLKKSLEKLQKAADEADRVFGPLIASPSASSTVPSDTMNRPPSVSSLSSEVFGRDEECKSIVDMLISEGDGSSNNSESRIQILAIWGIGGAGKTTLAQYIFNDCRIAEHFPMKFWVDVSRQLDALKVTAKMIVDVTGTERPSKDSLDALQARLKKHLEANKRFLLVLDDVWLDEGQNRLQLDQLLIPFNEVGDIGSRILVTTRAERTAKLMGAKQIIPVKELESEFCWSIIKQYAFSDSQKMISNPELVKIGDQIVNKLKNSPLAATLVGIQLGIQVDVNAWRMVLEGDILNDTRNALLWSYKKLPQHLQQCFSFCSLFPKGWIFEESELVMLWIAQGFVVVPSGSKLTIEDKGSEYFNDLLSFSFFQHHPQYFDNYVIHDLLHDLAENISQDHCFRIEGDERRTISTTVIHLSINVTKKLVVDIPNILELVNLRTFFIISLPKVDFISIFHDASKVFRKLKKLRILHLGDNSMSELHSSVCELKHVRYLQLSRVRTLSESLGQLYHLHFLVLGNACIEILPKSLSNLIKLKHLDTFPYDDKIFEVPEFGKLISLRRLRTYDANRRSQCGIDQLRNLRELRGSLIIGKLQNVENKAEACEAMLKGKIHLDKLVLHWDRETERNDLAVAAEVLEGLEPPCNLKELEIYSYIGGRSPKWLEDNQCLSNLQGLMLLNCSNLQVLPPLGQLPLLRKLKIRNAKVIEGIGPEFYGGGRDSFPCLKVLKLTGMEKWEQWHGAEGVELHPCLEELVIEDCPKLMEMPSLPPTLRKLRICNCPSLLQLPPFPCGLEEVKMKGPIGREGASLTHLAVGDHLTALQSLCIDGCENLRFVAGLELLPSLQCLWIWNCVRLSSPCLVTLPSSLRSIQITNCNEFSMPPRCLLGLTSLVELRMEGCPKLQSLPDLSDLRALQILRIEECPNLQSLPDLSDLRALEILHVEGCPNLQSLADLSDLRALEILHVERCPNLQSLADLSYLRALKILEVVGCPQLTCIGNLHRLTSLQWLTVLKCPKLTRGTVSSTDFKENLHCLTSLREMTIDETLLLSMLLQLEALNSLFQLTFSACHSLLLPANLGNLSSLQKLFIGSCPNLRSLPNLEYLSSLKSLFISNCPQIQSLPNLDTLSSLHFLWISECNEIRLLPNLDELSSLVSLTIGSCPQISSLPNLENLSSLNRLEISMCPQIEQLPNLDKLTSLDDVHIGDCNELRSLPSLDELSSLRRLCICSCPKIESLPDLENLSSLQQLTITHCPQLKTLPNLLPYCLEELDIFGCHPKLREKYGKGGPLRHRLRHISTLSGDLMYEVDSDDVAHSCCALPSWILKQ